MMASVATAGVLSWQLSQSLVESESQAQSATVIGRSLVIN